MKSIYLASMLAVASVVATDVSAVDWSDTSMCISYGSEYREQGINDGAVEVYAVYRNQLSMSAVSGQKLAYGPIRDFSLTTGFDLGTKNTVFASRPLKIVRTRTY